MHLHQVELYIFTLGAMFTNFILQFLGVKCCNNIKKISLV